MKNKDKIIPKPTGSEVMEYWEKCPAIKAGKKFCMFPDKYCRECIKSNTAIDIVDQLALQVASKQKQRNADPVALTYRELGVIALALPKLDILMPNFCEGHTDEETLTILEKIVKMKERMGEEGTGG